MFWTRISGIYTQLEIAVELWVSKNEREEVLVDRRFWGLTSMRTHSKPLSKNNKNIYNLTEIFFEFIFEIIL